MVNAQQTDLDDLSVFDGTLDELLDLDVVDPHVDLEQSQPF